MKHHILQAPWLIELTSEYPEDLVRIGQLSVKLKTPVRNYCTNPDQRALQCELKDLIKLTAE